MELHLMRPEWLWSLVPAGVLALLLWRQRDQGNWSDVISVELLPFLVSENSSGKGKSKLWLLLLIGWLLAAVAASGPSFQKIPQPIHRKQDALVMVLDLSFSMKSADLAPSRLDRGRQKLLDLLERRGEGQTGLVAYAGDAHVVSPLTDDRPTITNLLPSLHPEMMPVPGSAPRSAVALAIELLKSAGIRNGRILLVTDGIRAAEITPLQRQINEAGVELSILGLGTESGAPIPLPRGGFLKDRHGAIVLPGLDEQPLRKLAAAASGRYHRMSIDESDLDYLLADGSAPLSTRTIALDRTADTWEDQGYWLILPLLLLTLLLFRRGWVVCLLPLLLLFDPQPAAAQGWDSLWRTADQRAQRALQAGDPATAEALFDDSDWAGVAAFRADDYDSAAEYFSRNAGTDGWYNRGNALARSGRLEEAMHAYRRSLAVWPDQEDAKFNLQLLQQLLDQQKQQQQQQQQRNEPGQQEQEQQQSQQDSSGENQQDGNRSERSDDPSSAGQPQDPQQTDTQQANSQQGSGDNAAEQLEASTESHISEGQSPNTAEKQQAEALAAATESRDPQQIERDQAMEQWLRRVPDDPSGLLREKFRYESRQRAPTRSDDDELYW